MRLPFVIPSSDQNSLSRFVSRTTFPATFTSVDPDAGMARGIVFLQQKQETRSRVLLRSKLLISCSPVQDPFYRCEFWRSRAMPDGPLDGRVGKLLSRLR